MLSRSSLPCQVVLICLAHPCYEKWLSLRSLYVDSVILEVSKYLLRKCPLLPGDVSLDGAL